MIAFLDLETTGLDANKNEVLEVACIVTDDKMVEVARFHSLIWTGTQFYELDEFIRDMHTKNGLWAELCNGLARADLTDRESADRALASFIREHAVRVGPDGKGRIQITRPQLAGNTISFDRAFMKKHLPRAEAELHYRNLDVSTLNEMAKRFWPVVWEKRPRLTESAAHRAEADAEDSLRVARYYSEALGPVITQ